MAVVVVMTSGTVVLIGAGGVTVDVGVWKMGSAMGVVLTKSVARPVVVSSRGLSLELKMGL